MIRANNYTKFKKPKSALDTQINIRINSRLLSEFRSIANDKYQDKIRELMQMYIDAYKRKMNDKR